MALQRFGMEDMDRMLGIVEDWSEGKAYERRAACAALCEPKLLGTVSLIRRVLKMLDGATAFIEKAKDRENEGFDALKKGLGYCWSVAVAAAPAEGKAVMEKWFASGDKDVRWILRENLKKERLERADAETVKRWKKAIGIA
jgi:hypothetical protein